MPQQGLWAPGRSEARRPARGPGPEEVVAADRAERIQRFTGHVQTRAAPALQGPRIDLGQADPAPGHLGLAIALVPGPWQLAAHQALDQAESFTLPELREGPARRNAGTFGQRI